MKISLQEFTFDSDFDSGNLAKVIAQHDIHDSGGNYKLTRTSETKEKSGSKSPRPSSSRSSLASQGSETTNSTIPRSSKFNGTKKSSNSEKKQIREYQFHLWTNPDGYGNIEPPSKNRTWFHFSVVFTPDKGGHDDQKLVNVRFKIMNLNKVGKLFSAGMRPFFRSAYDSNWRPIPCTPLTNPVNDGIQLEFQFAFSTDKALSSNIHSGHSVAYGTKSHPAPFGCYFFCYAIPYSFQKLQMQLDKLDVRFSRVEKIPISSRIPLPVRSLHKPSQQKMPPSIYYHRDVLIESYDGRRLDILTISSTEGILSDHEPSIQGLHPEKYKLKRPRRFLMNGSKEESSMKSANTVRKSFFFVSARVHPGETVASYMLDGFIAFILSSDPHAVLLRSLFVFKIIPMLNPDGVVRGNYRCDARGVNLNRIYHCADPTLHPTIWATTKYINEVLVPLGTLKWYFDFHGHANKWGCFFLGNWIPHLPHQIEMMTFTRFMYLRCGTFDISECDYTPKGMIEQDQVKSNDFSEKSFIMSAIELERASEKTKDGTGRVAIYRGTGAIHCYTFEANYFGIKAQRRQSIRSQVSQNGEAEPFLGSPKARDDGKAFSLRDLNEMGQSLALAVYDTEVSEKPFLSIASAAISSTNRNEVIPWAMNKVRRMYEKVQIPFDSQKMFDPDSMSQIRGVNR